MEKFYLAVSLFISALLLLLLFSDYLFSQQPSTGTGRAGPGGVIASSGLPLSGGTMQGDIDLDGYSIILDQDGDSKIQNDRTSGVEDDTVKWLLGNNDFMSWDYDGSTFYSPIENRGLVEFCIGDCAVADNNPTSWFAEGSAEIDGELRTDGQLDINGNMDVAANVVLGFGGLTVNDVSILADETRNQFMLALGPSVNRHLIFGIRANQLKDCNHSDLGSAATYWHSETSCGVTDVEWGLAYHDGSSFHITDNMDNLWLHSADTYLTGNVDVDGTLTIGDLERCFTIPAQSAFLGPTAPTATTVGTFRGLAFDADDETVYLSMEISADWLGGTSDDMTFKIYWTNEPGDALANTETIKFDMSYRCIDFDTNEVIDNGNATSVTVTYTQSGAGTDKETHESAITIDANDPDNPIVKGYVCSGVFDRDKTADTYAGDAIIYRWEICYDSNGIPDHF